VPNPFHDPRFGHATVPPEMEALRINKFQVAIALAGAVTAMKMQMSCQEIVLFSPKH
jgi:hypothetical protein